MKKLVLALFFSALLSTGCANMHDENGWEHEGDSSTHEDTTPYLFEHKH